VNPEIDQFLSQSFLALVTEMGPALATDYARSSANLTGLMLHVAATEYDRAAEVRAAENADFTRVLSAALPVISDAVLRGSVEEAVAGEARSLRISDLNAANAALRRVLIEAHAWVETQHGAAARRVDAMIWGALRRSAERRALSLPRLG
jgi:hypothetical protein